MLTQLKTRKIRVARHKIECEACGTRYECYSDVPDEGFGYAAILYENEFGREVFFHSAEEAAYSGPPSERIVALNESFERSGEKIKIRRKQPVCATCPECGSKLSPTKQELDEVFIEAYEIFSAHIG